jgi:hypothetical protein
MANGDESEMRAMVIVRAWQDPEFKARFIATPAAALREMGIPVDESVEYRVIENSASVHYIVLPAKPRLDVSADDVTTLTSVWSAQLLTTGIGGTRKGARPKGRTTSGARTTIKESKAKKARGTTGPGTKRGSGKKRGG